MFVLSSVDGSQDDMAMAKYFHMSFELLNLEQGPFSISLLKLSQL